MPSGGYFFDSADLSVDNHEGFVEVVYCWTDVTRDQVNMASYAGNL